MFNSKFFQPSSLAGYGVILSILNQVIDINEFGAAGDAMQAAASQGGGAGLIIGAGIAAALAAIFKHEGAGNGEKK